MSHRITPPTLIVPVRWDEVLRSWYWKCLRCGAVSRAYTHRYTALREAKEHPPRAHGVGQAGNW